MENIWKVPEICQGPPLTDRAYTRRCAVEYAKTSAENGIDWQETQANLLNLYPYGLLFAGMVDEEVEEESMSIIREGEELAYGDTDDANPMLDWKPEE